MALGGFYKTYNFSALTIDPLEADILSILTALYFSRFLMISIQLYFMSINRIISIIIFRKDFIPSFLKIFSNFCYINDVWIHSKDNFI